MPSAVDWVDHTSFTTCYYVLVFALDYDLSIASLVPCHLLTDHHTILLFQWNSYLESGTFLFYLFC